MRAIHCTRVSPDVIFLIPYGSSEVYLTLFSRNKDENEPLLHWNRHVRAFFHTYFAVLA